MRPACGLLTPQTLDRWITKSWQCYRSGSINSLCEMSKSGGTVWLTVGQTSSRRSLNDWSVAISAAWSVSFGQRQTVWICEMIFTALHVMQTRYCDENSVCPSVCPSVRLSVCPSVRLSVCPSVRLSVCPSVTRVYCDKMVERSVQIYIPYERTFSLVFWEEGWLVGGRPLLPKILGQPTPVGAKSPIFNQ